MGTRTQKKISFGGITNSSIMIYIYIYETLCHVWLHGPLFCALALPMWTMWSPASVQNNHMAAPVKVAAPELSGTFRTLPPQPTPKPTEPSGTCLRNRHQHAPELSGTCRYPPTEPSRTFRNPLEPSGTCLRNLHQHTPELAWALSLALRNLHRPQNSPELSGTLAELSGTLRNLPLEPTPAHAGILSPEPAPATRIGAHRSLSGLKTPWAYAVGELSCPRSNWKPTST